MSVEVSFLTIHGRNYISWLPIHLTGYNFLLISYSSEKPDISCLGVNNWVSLLPFLSACFMPVAVVQAPAISVFGNNILIPANVPPSALFLQGQASTHNVNKNIFQVNAI